MQVLCLPGKKSHQVLGLCVSGITARYEDRIDTG